MKLKAIQNRVVVRRVEAEKVTPGGILLTTYTQVKPSEGIVLSVGQGGVSATGVIIIPDVKVGDRVLFSKHGGQEVIVDGDELVVLTVDDILAIVEE